MGYFAANNIHQRIQKKVSGKEPAFLELEEIPPMIGLAVGKKAVSYWPQAGMSSGEDVMKAFFGDDLGFTSEYTTLAGARYDRRLADMSIAVCWNHMRLGGKNVL
jgi:hypothetical protein